MNIYVGNLPFSTEENAVRELFEQYGAVASVKLIKDRFTGRSKGFAFVTMDDAEGQAAIDAVNNKDFQGKTLRVSVARNENEGGPRPAGRSGGFNRDRGGDRGGFGGDRGGFNRR